MHCPAAFLVLLSTASAMTIQCYFNANSTQIVEFPRALDCVCAKEVEEFSAKVFEDFDADLAKNIDTVSIRNCDKLILNLTYVPPNIVHKVDIVIEDTDEVQLSIRDTKDFVHQLVFERVGSVETTFVGDPGLTTLHLYLYIIIGVSALLGLVILSIPLIIWCVRRKRVTFGKKNKKVTRAESWRYEANMYVNPPPGSARQQQVQQMVMPYLLTQQSDAAVPLVADRPLPNLTRLMEQQNFGRLDDESPHSMRSHAQYTDSSLQYADFSSGTEDDGDTGERSAKSSGPYDSSNRVSTLPIAQQQ